MLKLNQRFKLVGLGIALIGMVIGAIDVKAVQLADGTVSFERSPRLVNAVTTYKGASVPYARYYFTLQLPADAGEPLQQVTIAQRKGIETIRFELDETVAFQGLHTDKGEKLAVKSVVQDEDSLAISVTFAQPIEPGNTFTVGLEPRRNPRYGGVYLFGVTAFPAGEKSLGLYLGVGRFHFYRSGDGIH